MNLNHPHPGEILRNEVMAPLELTLFQAAERFGVSVEDLADVLAGDMGITRELAEGLEREGFSTAGFWMALQAEFDKK